MGPDSPKAKAFVGTPGYIAPEVLIGRICPQSDLWSVGVIFYFLMTGLDPWEQLHTLRDGVVEGKSARKLFEQLQTVQADFDTAPWPDFPSARDLCRDMLAF